jgi:hypothetical protein
MSKILLPLIIVVVAVVVGCIALQPAETSEDLSEEELVVLLSEPNTVDWEYPVAAKTWYPGENPHETNPYLYYTIRCWPGCHDPASQPRPHSY